MMTIKGLLFDKDGTLFDFQRTWAKPVFELIHALSGGDAESMVRLADALGFDLKAAVFLPGSAFVKEISRDVVNKIEPFSKHLKGQALYEYYERHLLQVIPYGITDLSTYLLSLKESMYVLGIATNATEAATMTQLQQVGIESLFEFIAGSDSGYGTKPSTGQCQAFLQHAKLKPEEAAMIGDSTYDLIPARQLGMLAVGVVTGANSHDALAPYADVVIDSIVDLPALLASDD